MNYEYDDPYERSARVGTGRARSPSPWDDVRVVQASRHRDECEDVYQTLRPSVLEKARTSTGYSEYQTTAQRILDDLARLKQYEEVSTERVDPLQRKYADTGIYARTSAQTDRYREFEQSETADYSRNTYRTTSDSAYLLDNYRKSDSYASGGDSYRVDDSRTYGTKRGYDSFESQRSERNSETWRDPPYQSGGSSRKNDSYAPAVEPKTSAQEDMLLRKRMKLNVKKRTEAQQMHPPARGGGGDNRSAGHTRGGGNLAYNKGGNRGGKVQNNTPAMKHNNSPGRYFNKQNQPNIDADSESGKPESFFNTAVKYLEQEAAKSYQEAITLSIDDPRSQLCKAVMSLVNDEDNPFNAVRRKFISNVLKKAVGIQMQEKVLNALHYSAIQLSTNPKNKKAKMLQNQQRLKMAAQQKLNQVQQSARSRQPANVKEVVETTAVAFNTPRNNSSGFIPFSSTPTSAFGGGFGSAMAPGFPMPSLAPFFGPPPFHPFPQGPIVRPLMAITAGPRNSGNARNQGGNNRNQQGNTRSQLRAQAYKNVKFQKKNQNQGRQRPIPLNQQMKVEFQRAKAAIRKNFPNKRDEMWKNVECPNVKTNMSNTMAKQFNCYSCEMDFEKVEEYVAHMESAEHKAKFEEFSTKCKTKMDEVVEKHEELFPKTEATEEDTSTFDDQFRVRLCFGCGDVKDNKAVGVHKCKMNSTLLKCFACKQKFNTVYAFAQHCRTDNHMKQCLSDEDYEMITGPTLTIPSYKFGKKIATDYVVPCFRLYCILCRVSFDSQKKMDNHVVGPMHYLHYKNCMTSARREQFLLRGIAIEKERLAQRALVNGDSPSEAVAADGAIEVGGDDNDTTDDFQIVDEITAVDVDVYATGTADDSAEDGEAEKFEGDDSEGDPALIIADESIADETSDAATEAPADQTKEPSPIVANGTTDEADDVVEEPITDGTANGSTNEETEIPSTEAGDKAEEVEAKMEVD